MAQAIALCEEVDFHQLNNGNLRCNSDLQLLTYDQLVAQLTADINGMNSTLLYNELLDINTFSMEVFGVLLTACIVTFLIGHTAGKVARNMGRL